MFMGNPPGLGNFPSGTYWAILGNAGTVDGTNFLGTTDNIPLSFRVNNSLAGRIDNTKRNAFFGFNAGGTVYNQVTGVDNTFLGHNAGKAVTEAVRCVFIGSGAGALFAGTAAQNSQDNVGIGYGALGALTRDFGNVAVGWSALLNQVTGTLNTAIGNGAGLTVTTGQQLTMLGSNADVTAGTENGSIALGSGATISANNQWVTGSTGVFINQTQLVYTAALIHSEFFRTTVPNGSQVGTRGDLAFVDDGANGSVWIKATGAATNTGWVDLNAAGGWGTTGTIATLTGNSTLDAATFSFSIINSNSINLFAGDDGTFSNDLGLLQAGKVLSQMYSQNAAGSSSASFSTDISGNAVSNFTNGFRSFGTNTNFLQDNVGGTVLLTATNGVGIGGTPSTFFEVIGANITLNHNDADKSYYWAFGSEGIFYVGTGSGSTATTCQGLMLNVKGSKYQLGNTVGPGAYVEVDDVNSIVNVIVQTSSISGLYVTGDQNNLIHTGTTLLDNAGSSVGTLTNAPKNGDPTKWVAIDDNGTQRFFPTWTP